MILTITIAVAVIVVYQLFSNYQSLKRNVAIAKSSGLPVVVSPWTLFNLLWLSTFKLWKPLMRKFLPDSLQGLWIDILHPEWAYMINYMPFEKLGMDVFLVAAPGGINAFVADAEAITQITTRRNDFPKPLDMYAGLNIYGKNLVTTEGPDWRMHRKLVAPSFGEKNNELVFTESLHHTRSLLGLWAGHDGSGNVTITDPSHDAMVFALYVISSAGFDVRVRWPHEESQSSTESRNHKDSMFVGSKVPEGHTMNYRDALGHLLHSFFWTQILPQSWLVKSPIKIHRTVGEAVAEWGKYMDELYEVKKRQVASGEKKGGIDLFDALIRGSGILDAETSNVTKSDLQGNAFVLMLAGHETTANSLHFSMIYLAMNFASQKRLQEDIDRIFQGQPISEWKYEEHFQKLFGSMPAAVMNETLRLLQPILNIPKSTKPDSPQPLTLDGKQYMIPAGTHIFLNAAVHRNPKYWPAPAAKTGAPDIRDVDQFRPERWIVDASAGDQFVDVDYDDEDLRGPSGEDTSAQLFKPVKGSYIPFSDGFRSCIGRRFAQVEILVALAAIFSQYTVELAVDDFISDEELEKLPRGGAERSKIYKQAVDRADDFLKNKVSSMITLQLRGVSIPIRLMKRGEERFAHC